jgi:nucleotide-binding universal stress UspA family protein
MTAFRALLCVDGGPAERLLAAALPLVSADTVWVPVHVVDARARRDLGLLRGGITGAGPLSRSQQHAISTASGEHTRNVMGATEASLRALGLRSEPFQIGAGEPGREICRVASAVGAGLIVIFASRRRPTHAGPGSIGHTARFVLDHAPCPVLLIRGGQD